MLSAAQAFNTTAAESLGFLYLINQLTAVRVSWLHEWGLPIPIAIGIMSNVSTKWQFTKRLNVPRVQVRRSSGLVTHSSWQDSCQDTASLHTTLNQCRRLWAFRCATVSTVTALKTMPTCFGVKPIANHFTIPCSLHYKSCWCIIWGTFNFHRKSKAVRV